jgi:flagellar motor switch protein FliN
VTPQVEKLVSDDLTHWGENAAAPAAAKAAAAPFAAAPAKPVIHDMDMVMDLPVKVMIELGRTKMPLGDLMSVQNGGVIELDIEAGEPLNLVVNGCLIAQGEVVIVDDRYGIRLTDIISPSERLRKSKN